MSSKTQTRGNCQICGCEQAVVGGNMSKHGYTVEHGWFSGVCAGNRYQPMQISREATDSTIKAILTECATLRALAASLSNGSIKPEFVIWHEYDYKKREDVQRKTAFADAPEYRQIQQVESDIYQANSRASQGELFAAHLKALADSVHGQPLRIVDISAVKPAPIFCGETRTSPSGKTLTVTYVNGARIHWQDERKNKGWTGSSAWRKYQLAGQ